jgi:hypothetical protein
VRAFATDILGELGYAAPVAPDGGAVKPDAYSLSDTAPGFALRIE